jgi:KDO2-lipid IV(A) lauroyltransferase
MTQSCADVLGAAITAHTSDWHMLQRVFLDDLDRDRLAAADPAVDATEGAR